MRARFQSCVFDSGSRTLTRDGEPVPLTLKAFALLEKLIAASPAAVSKEDLYRHLWPDTFVEQGNLHNLVSEIRAAIGDEEHEVLRTVHRFGYAFAGGTVSRDDVRFAVLVGEDEFPLSEGPNIIGRDPEAAVVINAPDVSRHHARLTVTAGVVTLEDLGSKNGTFLDSKQVTAPVEVTENDAIAIGRTQIRLRAIRSLATTVTSI